MPAERSTQVKVAPASISGSDSRPVPAINSRTGPFTASTSDLKNGTSYSAVT